MVHELDKLDNFLDIPIGTSYRVLIQHSNPDLLNTKLVDQGIILDQDGIVPKSQRAKWKELMIKAEISSKYWRDPESLILDSPIEDL